VAAGRAGKTLIHKRWLQRRRARLALVPPALGVEDCVHPVQRAKVSRTPFFAQRRQQLGLPDLRSCLSRVPGAGGPYP